MSADLHAKFGLLEQSRRQAQTEPVAVAIPVAAAGQTPAPEEYRPFKRCQNGDSPFALALRLASRDLKAVPYAWISWIDFDPSTGIALYLTQGFCIRILGRALDELALLVVKREVEWVCQADSATARLLGNATVVESFRFDKYHPEEFLPGLRGG